MDSKFVATKFRSLQKHVGFWKTASMLDQRGLGVMSNMSGGKPIPSLPTENIKNNFVDHTEPLMDPLNTSNCQRTPNNNAASQKVGMNTGYYEDSLFSSSMSDLFNRTRGLASKGGLAYQSANTIQSNFDDDEPLNISEEIEAQAIGNLLPDDDDDLFFCSADDDFFCSVGGLELESDDNIKFYSKMTSKIDYSRIFSSQEKRSNKHQSSRMLIVRNVDSNIED